MFYIAVICDWVVVANIFDYIFQPDNGSLVNYVLLKLHIISSRSRGFRKRGAAIS